MSLRTASWVGLVLDGRYRVTGKLGEGGMADIYKARDTRLDCDVVLKVPQAVLLRDPAFARRFTHEVRSLVRLTHPHVVKISDAGVHEGTPFAVMQFLPGGSLGDRRGSAAGQPALALGAWLEGVAAALDFIHTQHFVHRDVKPENILFDEHGHVYLSDFGIAKALGDGRSQGQRTVLTNPGAVQGTLPYMAPELIVGQPYDGRVDQFGLAVTVYELLSGRFPFSGETPTAVYEQQKIPPLPLAALVSGVPEALSAAVQQALTRDPKQRYASCRAFSEAVLKAAEQAARQAHGSASPPPVLSVTPRTSLTLTCPGCRKTYALPPSAGGKKVRCPSCEAAFRAPQVLVPTPFSMKVTPTHAQVPPLPDPQPRQANLETQHSARPTQIRFATIVGAIIGGVIAGLLSNLAYPVASGYSRALRNDAVLCNSLGGLIAGLVAGWQSTCPGHLRSHRITTMACEAAIGTLTGIASAAVATTLFIPYGLFLGFALYGAVVGAMFGCAITFDARRCVSGLILGTIAGQFASIVSTYCGDYQLRSYCLLTLAGVIIGATWVVATAHFFKVRWKEHILPGAGVCVGLFMGGLFLMSEAYSAPSIQIEAPVKVRFLKHGDQDRDWDQPTEVHVKVNGYHNGHPIVLRLEEVSDELDCYIVYHTRADDHQSHMWYNAKVSIKPMTVRGGRVRLVATAGSLRSELVCYVTVDLKN